MTLWAIPRLLCPWDSPGKNVGVGFYALPPGDLPDPGIQPTSPTSPALAGGFFTTEPPGKSNKLHKPFKFGCFWWNEKVVLADLYVPPNSNSLDSMTIVHLISLECYKISKANPSS